MTRTGRSLHEWRSMGPEGLAAMAHFIKCAEAGGALWRAMGGHEDYSMWDSQLMANKLLSEIYDLINSFKYSFASANSKKKPKKPKPYPAPWAQTKGSERFGKDPVKISEFENWWKSKGGGSDD